METRRHKAQFNVGDRVKVFHPGYEERNGEPFCLDGSVGKVTEIIFPGEVLYEFAGEGYANGTGAIQYTVEMENWKDKYNRYHFSGNELVKAEGQTDTTHDLKN